MGQLPVAPHTQEPDIRTTTPLPSFPSETPAISTRSNLNLVSQSASTLRRSACTAFCSSLVSASLSPAPGQSLHVFRDGEGLRRPRTLRHKAEGNQDHASERAHRKGILAHFGKGSAVRVRKKPTSAGLLPRAFTESTSPRGFGWATLAWSCGAPHDHTSVAHPNPLGEVDSVN